MLLGEVKLLRRSPSFVEGFTYSSTEFSTFDAV